MEHVRSAAQSIADALAPTASAPSARWRWGTVVAVASDGTMTVNVGGTPLAGVRAAQHCTGAKVGDRVRVAYLGTDAMVDAVRATAKLMSLPTIDGALTATGRITGAGVTSTNGAQITSYTDLHSTNISLSTLPTSGEAAGDGSFNFYDKDGTFLGTVFPIVSSTGNVGLSFQVRRTVNGTNYYNWLRLYLDASGNPIVGFRGNEERDAWRDALNVVASSDQSQQNARFINLTGATQVYGLWAKCINANNTTYNGKEVGVIFGNGSLGLWDSAAQSTIWSLSGLSGTVDLDSTSWATLATNVAYRRHRGWAIVKFSNYAYSASGTEVTLGTLPAGFRPNTSVYAALAGISGGSTSDAYCAVDTSGSVRVNGRASGAHLYGEIVFPV